MDCCVGGTIEEAEKTEHHVFLYAGAISAMQAALINVTGNASFVGNAAMHEGGDNGGGGMRCSNAGAVGLLGEFETTKRMPKVIVTAFLSHV